MKTYEVHLGGYYNKRVLVEADWASVESDGSLGFQDNDEGILAVFPKDMWRGFRAIDPLRYNWRQRLRRAKVK